MTKNFDKICENILSSTNNNAQQNNNGAQQNNNAQQPPQQNNNQQNQMQDEELFKVLQQKLNDQKFKDALLKMLNPQQNAANQSV